VGTGSVGDRDGRDYSASLGGAPDASHFPDFPGGAPNTSRMGEVVFKLPRLRAHVPHQRLPRAAYGCAA
jgi:hypothetical protein